MSQELKSKYGISTWKSYKLNYWNIPKCGATAVKAALFKKNINNQYEILANLHSINTQEYISIDTALSNGYINFTLIRDPFDRVISMYKDKALRRPVSSDKNIRDFDYFLDNVIMKSDDETCDPHFRSMSSYIQPEGKLLVDRVFNFNNIHKFLEDYNLSFQKVNVTNPVDIVLSEEHKDKIRTRYSKDMNLIQYLE